MIFPIGEPNVNFSKYFIGNSYLKPLTNPVFIANVTFEPAVAIIGISIKLQKVVDKFLFVLQVEDTIRKKEKKFKV